MKVTRDELHELELASPTYKWIETEEKLSPIKMPIAKVQKLSAEFNIYQAYQAIGQLKGQQDKRLEQNEADQVKIDLFEAELELIKKALGVDDLEEQYKNECLAEAAVAELTKPE